MTFISGKLNIQHLNSHLTTIKYTFRFTFGSTIKSTIKSTFKLNLQSLIQLNGIIIFIWTYQLRKPVLFRWIRIINLSQKVLKYLRATWDFFVAPYNFKRVNHGEVYAKNTASAVV